MLDRIVHPTPAARPNAQAVRLFLAVYAALILFGSLWPFSGWRPAALWSPHFLFAPLPRFITRTDLTTNLLVYLPLGYALALALAQRLPRGRAIILAAVLCTAYSLFLESLQQLLPNRIASNVDIAINGLGALFGALATRHHARWVKLEQSLRRWRDRWFLPGGTVSAGLALLALWYLAQFSLMPFPGMGWLNLYLRPLEAGLAIAKLNWPWALAVFLEMAALGCLTAVLLRPGHRVRGLKQLFVTAFLVKVLVAILLLRLKVLGGVLSLETLGSFLAAYWLLVIPAVQRYRIAMAAGLLGASILLRLVMAKYALIPDSNPFNIVGLADLAASLWPYLGIAVLAALCLNPGKAVKKSAGPVRTRP